MLNTFLKILGADPQQYRLLLKTDKLVHIRRESSKGFLSDSPRLLVALYAISSIFVSLSAFALDRFSFTLLTLFVSMTLMAFTVISRLEVVINPPDYRMLAHMPISSRTYFLVKFTRALLYVVVFAGVLNIPPAIFGIWSKNAPILFPASYLPISFMATFFVIGLVSVFYGYLIKLYRWGKFRDLVAYSQLLFAILIPLSYYLLPLLISMPRIAGMDSDYITALKWIYLLPYSWFAGLVHFTLGEFHVHFLYLSILAVVSTVLLVVIPLGRISLKYSEHLSFLLESANIVWKVSRTRRKRLATFLKNTETRAGFELVSIYLKRDRNTKTRLFAKLGVSLAAVIPMIPTIPELMGRPFSIGLAIGIPIYSFSVCAYAVSCLLSILRFSEDWKAAWIFTIVPVESHDSFFKGAKLAIISYFIAPYCVILTGIYVFLWSPFSAVVYILPSLIGSLCYLSFCWASMVTLPFSQEPQQKKGIDDLVTFVLGLIVFSGALGIQYIAYQFHVYLYITVYIVTIGLGVIFSKRKGQPAKVRPIH